MGKGNSRLPVCVSVALCLIFFLPLLSSAGPSERVLSFQSYITVHRDASMTVQETIRVKSEGLKIRHGIYRDFPTRYRDMLGNSYITGFDIGEVLKDGLPEPFHIEDRSNGKRVYIENRNVLLSPGEYTYTLVYRTDHQLGFFKDYDELYWNVTGNAWEFPIDETSAAVALPEGADPRRQGYDRCDRRVQGVSLCNGKGQDEHDEPSGEDTGAL